MFLVGPAQIGSKREFPGPPKMDNFPFDNHKLSPQRSRGVGGRGKPPVLPVHITAVWRGGSLWTD